MENSELKKCEEGHLCNSDCGKHKDCPCDTEHCCSMTPKDNLCGDVGNCFFCTSLVPDLADLKEDEVNER